MSISFYFIFASVCHNFVIIVRFFLWKILCCWILGMLRLASRNAWICQHLPIFILFIFVLNHLVCFWLLQRLKSLQQAFYTNHLVLRCNKLVKAKARLRLLSSSLLLTTWNVELLDLLLWFYYGNICLWRTRGQDCF